MRSYDRDADPVEFGRVVTLADGVFAIALTLLVLDLAQAGTTLDAPLATALPGLAPRFLAFAISVAVVGTFYRSHHEFVSGLQRLDGGLMSLTITYLSFIVLIPFVQGVLSRTGEPLALAMYAAVLGVAAIVEGFMLGHAYRRGLLRAPQVGRAARFEILRAAAPVVIFLASIGLVYVLGLWTMVLWFSLWPIDSLLDRLERRGR